MTPIKTDMDHLESILRELKEAVIGCDYSARILLYNSAARRLFHQYDGLGLGKSLYEVCTQAPIEHTLRMLQRRAGEGESLRCEDRDAWLVCSTIDGNILLQCHITQIPSGGEKECVYVFAFEDMTRQIDEMGRQGYLLEKMIQELRAPLTNLCTAAQNLKSFPQMDMEMRQDFESIMIRESEELSDRFEAVVRESEKNVNRQWPLFDVYSGDLIGCIARRFSDEGTITVNMVGIPLWLHADSYSLMLVLVHLIRFLRETRKISEVDVEALLGDRRVYIDIIWQGKPVSQAEVDSLVQERLPGSVAGITVAEVLERHDSELWSQPHRHGRERSLFRLPVPDSRRQWEDPAVHHGINKREQE